MKLKKRVMPRVQRTIARDPHNPGTIYVHMESDETPIIERNKRIRAEGLLKQDSRSPLYEGDVIAFSFQFPSMFEFNLTKLANPDIFAELDLGGDHALRAAERLSILCPQYVTIARRGDALRSRSSAYGR